jgi:hypothetical protein
MTPAPSGSGSFFWTGVAGGVNTLMLPDDRDIPSVGSTLKAGCRSASGRQPLPPFPDFIKLSFVNDCFQRL